jgi:hypothetical protein
MPLVNRKKEEKTPQKTNNDSQLLHRKLWIGKHEPH